MPERKEVFNVKNNLFNKLRSYPQKCYWYDTDGLVSEKYYRKGFKKYNNRITRHRLKQIREVDV